MFWAVPDEYPLILKKSAMLQTFAQPEQLRSRLVIKTFAKAKRHLFWLKDLADTVYTFYEVRGKKIYLLCLVRFVC